MENLFKKLFNTPSLTAIYSSLPSKLIYKDRDSIKSILKEKLDKSNFKRIFKLSMSIKDKYKRPPKKSNKMIPIDTLIRCLPPKLRENPSDSAKFKYIRTFMETLKSEVGLEIFKKSKEYERIAGFLVGNEHSLKMGSDGTVRLLI